MPSFFANSERTLSAYFQFAQMDLARATPVLIRVLRTFSGSIAKNLHKLKICLRFYFFTKKLNIQAIKNFHTLFIKQKIFYNFAEDRIFSFSKITRLRQDL